MDMREPVISVSGVPMYRIRDKCSGVGALHPLHEMIYALRG